MPAPGLITHLRPPSGPGIRDDSGVTAGYTVPVFYDSMIAKLVAWGGSRPDAIARMTRALEEYEVLGIKTTIPFFLWLMREPDFLAARFDTTYLDRLLARRRESFSTFSDEDERRIAIAAALDAMARAGRGNGAAASIQRRSAWTTAARLDGLRG
jgi:acetyl-CoA carboxylase biotin carboxylase subunit